VDTGVGEISTKDSLIVRNLRKGGGVTKLPGGGSLIFRVGTNLLASGGPICLDKKKLEKTPPHLKTEKRAPCKKGERGVRGDIRMDPGEPQTEEKQRTSSPLRDRHWGKRLLVQTKRLLPWRQVLGE